MFSSAVQPGIVSLFSSTGSDPLQLFSTHCDSTLHSDAFVGLVNDRPSHSKPRSPKNLVSDDEAGFLLDQTVLHIQSPALPKTYIQCPSQPGKELGLKHSWIHIQARSLGICDWSFEVGIADQLERKGIVRLSTFQVCSPAVVYIQSFINRPERTSPQASCRIQWHSPASSAIILPYKVLPLNCLVDNQPSPSNILTSLHEHEPY